MTTDAEDRTLIEKARAFCLAAHAATGQERKFTGEPYWTHPFAVADTVRQTPGSTAEMLAAAYLHDVVEDTAITLDLIGREFGPAVEQLVAELTAPEHPPGTPANDRLRRVIAHALAASDQAKTVKLGDVLDNTFAVADRDPAFAVSYMAGKAALLPALRGGDAGLFERVRQVIGDYYGDAAPPPPDA